MKKSYLFFLISLLFFSCNFNNTCEHDRFGVVSADNNNAYIIPVLYHQHSAELKALKYQIFNMSKYILQNKLKDYSGNKKPAIIFDIDETILDNSFYQAQSIIENFKYPEKWKEWCLRESAPSVYGAVDFANFAKNSGVEVFYVSNRNEELMDATVNNLKIMGFPNANKDFVFLKQNETSKEQRRNNIKNNFEVLMYFGYSLNDFFSYAENKTVEERFNVVDSLCGLFGDKYIVIPNVMYGDWENAFYEYNDEMSHRVKEAVRSGMLKGF